MRRIISFVACSLLAFAANALDFIVYTSDAYLYCTILSREECTVEVSYASAKSDKFGEDSIDVVIPETVTYDGQEYTVTVLTGIYDSYTRSITIPKTIVQIGENHVENLKVYISDLAAWCKVKREGDRREGSIAEIYLNGEPLKTVVIPDDMTELDDFFFWNYKGIKQVIIPDNVSKLGKAVFYGCGSITSIDFGNGITEIPDGGNGLMERCTKLEKVTFGSALTKIGKHAFFFSGIKEVELPPSVKEIGDYAFSCSGLTTLPNLENVETIGTGAFGKCGFTSLDFSNWPTTKIDDQLFYDCHSLASLNLGDKITEIGNKAFEQCYLLASLTIPKNIKKIGMSAFIYGDALTSLTIESENCYIANKAFAGCDKLASITCTSMTPPRMGGSDVFEDVIFPKAKLYVPKGAGDAYGKANVWANFADIIEVDMGGDEPTEYEPEDLNHDGDINTADITHIYNRILYGKNYKE